ncbi:hypothetical protein L484_011981 [Morus notabilis]|uniref:Uncharacterized protein n=1 Tax=Morus notabilis TaxID=981085 RepID=W9RSD4_9ROSA|nr:hypothetical protein L484_011981 [Morus notabilis]
MSASEGERDAQNANPNPNIAGDVVVNQIVGDVAPLTVHQNNAGEVYGGLDQQNDVFEDLQPINDVEDFNVGDLRAIDAPNEEHPATAVGPLNFDGEQVAEQLLFGDVPVEEQLLLEHVNIPAVPFNLVGGGQPGAAPALNPVAGDDDPQNPLDVDGHDGFQWRLTRDNVIRPENPIFLDLSYVLSLRDLADDHVVTFSDIIQDAVIDSPTAKFVPNIRSESHTDIGQRRSWRMNTSE